MNKVIFYLVLLAVSGTISTHAFAKDPYSSVPLVQNYEEEVGVQEVKMLKAVVKPGGSIAQPVQLLEVTFGISANLGECHEITQVEMNGSQGLGTGGEKIISIASVWKENCGLERVSELAQVKFSYTALESAFPFGPQKTYFRFFAGMNAGLYWSLVYELDFTDKAKPKFNLVKKYAVSYGEIVE